MTEDQRKHLRIAMLSIHSSPLGEPGSEDTGGMSVYIRELAEELGRAGHRVDIYTCAEQREQGIVNMHGNVRLIHLHTGAHGRIPKDRLYPHLTGLFLELEDFRSRHGIRYDIVHSHYWLSGVVGNRAKELWKVPHVIDFHTTGLAKKIHCSDEQESQLRITLENKLARECDRVIASTEHGRESLHRYYSVPYEKIAFVPCGVNLDRFQPVSRKTARDYLSLPGDAPIILYVGRFAPVKGMDRLMNAMTYLRTSHHGVKLVIAGGGGGDASEALRRRSRRLGIHDMVLFRGKVSHDDLPMYYSAADVLVVPSFYESFSLVALESLACGTPVAGTRVGVVESIIQNGVTGEIARSPAPSEIARAAGNVLQNSHMSRKIIRESVEDHSWACTASALLREYLALTSEAYGNATLKHIEEAAYGFSC